VLHFASRLPAREKAAEHGFYSYGYDAVDRLIEADYPTFSPEAWTYDPLGNRLTDARTGESQWTYNANNELLDSIERTHAYDANGSPVAEYHPDGPVYRTFDYNAETRLRTVRNENGAPIAEYIYDPFGRRVRQTVYGPPGQNPATTWYLYSDAGLMAELAGSGAQQAFYLFPPDGLWSTDPILRKSGSSHYYYQSDHLGTPQQLIDATGAVVHTREMRAFGETRQTGVEDRWRFPGQVHDAETGWHYNYFRDYAPGLGRYVQSDPIGLYAGPNEFTYVLGNPIILPDPLGLMPDKCRKDPAPPHQCHFRETGTRQFRPTNNTRPFSKKTGRFSICIPAIAFSPRIRVGGRWYELPEMPSFEEPGEYCFQRYTETHYLDREYEIYTLGVLVCEQKCGSLTEMHGGGKVVGCTWRD
jgi:RHS repeat-associated protein